MAQVKIFYAKNDIRNFSFLIYDQYSREAWVIDPFDEKPMIDYIKKNSLIVKGILNTHQHWDHIKGNSALQSKCNCSVISRLQAEIELGQNQKILFLDTPGHTMDHQAFCWLHGTEIVGLFSGDTLFNGGVGNCKDGGNVETLFETTNKLKLLPDNVVLFPGHDYALKNLMFAKECEPDNPAIDEALKEIRDINTEEGIRWTLGQEKKVNPFLRLNSEELRENIINLKKPLDSASTIERDLFIKLRSLRDKW